MINYKNPTVELLPNPAGIDLAIQSMQLYLANLPWLEKSFGRAITQREALGEKDRATRLSGANYRSREITYPEVYQAKREPLNVMINDNLKAYSFFTVEDPQRFPTWRPLQTLQEHTQKINIIFWANLQKIDPSKDYRYSEELKEQALQLLARFSGFIIQEVFEEYDQVFAGFTLTETYRTYQKPPYFGFRVRGDLLGDMRNCSPLGTPVIVATPDQVIQFVAGVTPGFPVGGAATFTDERMSGKKILVYRNKFIEWWGNPGNGDTYFEKPTSGAGSDTVTFTPALVDGDRIQILI